MPGANLLCYARISTSADFSLHRLLLEQEQGVLMNNVAQTVQSNFWFMHDSAPLYFSLVDIQFHDDTFPK